MIKKGENMKKTLLIAAVLATAFTTNANAGGGRDLVEYLFQDQMLELPAHSRLNGNNTAKRIPLPLNIVNVDINSVIGAVVGTVIDPRGYDKTAYPGGKRPGLNVTYGRNGTGKCYSDPKGGGIFCN